MVVDLNPYIIRFGEFGIRWYGFFMAMSMAIGFYYFRRNGLKKGFSEDLLYNVVLVAVGFGLLGARALFVLTNWGDYASQPAEIIRIDHGGLAWHGGLLGGLVAGWVYLRLTKNGGWGTALSLADLSIPGLSVGYIFVRIGNIFNQELLGRTGELLPFDRHPAQVYGSLIGVMLLLINRYLARKNPPPGYLFGAFIVYYSVLRGLIEETFREMPLAFIHYVNYQWGFGFTSLTQLFTPPLILLGYLIMRWSVARQRLKNV